MAGLGNPAAQIAPQQNEPGPNNEATEPRADNEQAEGEAPTPEEQAQYDRFEQQLMGVLYTRDDNPQVEPQVIDDLRGNFDPRALAMFEEAQPPVTDSPQDCVATTAVLMTMLIEHTAQEDFSDDVVMHGGKAVIEQLIEIAEAAKIHDFDEQDIETVTYRAMDLYRIASPRIDPEALKAEFGKLVEADRAGQLGKVLPGLPGGTAMKQEQA